MDSEKNRIVVTGIGVIAPNGFGKDEFWCNCFAGVSGIRPITLFDTTEHSCHYAGEISNFEPAAFLGLKGLRNLDRTTLLAMVAAKLAFEDAKLEITDNNRNEIGVVLGSTMGSVRSISEFDKEGLREGPRYVNPALFPNTVINSPASQVAIRFGLRGLNTTISTGFSASLDALGYAMDMLELGRAKALLVGGVEELCIQTFVGFSKLGFLGDTSSGFINDFSSFKNKQRKTILGEGAVFFLLEHLDHAVERSAKKYAELLGYGSYFGPSPTLDLIRNGFSTAISRALDEARRNSEDIDYVSSCANGMGIFDLPEQDLVNKSFKRTAITSSPKLLLGESFSASGALQTALAIGVLTHQKIPRGVSRSRKPFSFDDVFIQTAIVNSFGLANQFASLIMQRSSVLEGV